MKQKNKIIEFCKDKCCPVVEKKDDKIILGDVNGIEGITTWNKNQFKDFIEAAKNGRFDELIK